MNQKILLIGQEFWVRQIAAGLERFAGLEVASIEVGRRLNISPLVAIQRLRSASLVLRVGFRPGARTWRGKIADVLIEAASSPSTIRATYWIGTDVQQARTEARFGFHPMRWRDPRKEGRRNIAGSKPLVDELRAIGIDAELMEFPWTPFCYQSPIPPLPNTFTILSYVPDTRYQFYFGPLIIEAARRLPHVAFEVMGGSGEWCKDPPSNLRFLGWVSNPAGPFARAACVLRLVEHDSIGGTAVEGLMLGRSVLYSGELPGSQKVAPDLDQVVDAIEAMFQRHASGVLQLDIEGAKWARDYFDPARRFAALAEFLRRWADAAPRATVRQHRNGPPAV